MSNTVDDLTKAANLIGKQTVLRRYPAEETILSNLKRSNALKVKVPPPAAKVTPPAAAVPPPAGAPVVINSINTGSTGTLKSTARNTIKYLTVIGAVIGGAFALGLNKLTGGNSPGGSDGKQTSTPFIETVADSIGVSSTLPQWLRISISWLFLGIVIPLAIYLFWQLGKASAR